MPFLPCLNAAISESLSVPLGEIPWSTRLLKKFAEATPAWLLISDWV